MKKRVFIIAACFIFCNFIPRVATRGITRPAQLSQELFTQHEAYNMAQCEAILRKAARIYRHDPQLYLEFINAHNKEGFTILQYAAATADYKSIARLISYAADFFGQGNPLLEKFINAKSSLGCTALLFSAMIGECKALEVLLDQTFKALAYKKSSVTHFLTLPHDKTNTTALHILAHSSSSCCVYTIIHKALKIVGKNSQEFNEFINASDSLGRTPLYFAHNIKVRHFLIKHSATSAQTVSPILQQALDLGQQLIDAVEDNDYIRFQNVLSTITTKYATTKDLLVSAIVALDGQGWTAYQHAAAHNKKDFLLYFLNKIQHALPNDPNSVISIVNAKDQEGKTALTLSLLRKHFDIANIIVKKSFSMLSNKLYFYLCINTPEEYNNRTPLVCATYNSTDTQDNKYFVAIQTVVEYMEKKFPFPCHAFYHFINSVDNFNASALSYATSARLRKFLISKGAIDTHSRTDGEQRTEFVGVERSDS